MPKTFHKIQLFLLSLLTFFSLSSCAGFFQDSGMVIDDITTTQDADGNTTVTISFTDDYYDDVVFTIPAPEDGKQGIQGPIGNGIAGIEKVTEDGKDYLVVTFTDDTMPPQKIELPALVSVSSITSSYDNQTGVTTVTITLTDGSEHEFTLQNGKDGAGIADIQTEVDEEGNTTITISYTDGRDDTVVQIPYKQGKDGRGIESITTQTIGDKYYLYVKYTGEEEEQVLEFDKPESTKWICGNGAPGLLASLQASEGDFYFDLTDWGIYLLQNGSWQQIANLKSDEISCTIEFDPGEGTLDGTYLRLRTCNKGDSLDISQIPTASREGYSFQGWYTSELGPNDPRSGKFTDLTPVTKIYTHLFAYYLPL